MDTDLLIRRCLDVFNRPDKWEIRQRLIDEAEKKFRVGESQLLKAIAQIAGDFNVCELTDFNYSTCFKFVVTFPTGASFPADRQAAVDLLKRLNAPIYFLTLEVSVIADVYCYGFAEDMLEFDKIRRTQQLNPFNAEQSEILDRLTSHLQSMSYCEISDEKLKIPLPDIELSLAAKGEVKVFNCLFDDCSGGYSGSTERQTFEW